MVGLLTFGNLDHTLSSNQRCNGFMDRCKNLFGIFVADYWEDKKWVNLNRVDKKFNDLNKIPNVVFLV